MNEEEAAIEKAMDIILNMSPEKERFYTDKSQSFDEMQILWDKKKKLNNEILTMFFVTLASDVQTITKISHLVDRSVSKEYTIPGSMVKLKTYCDADEKKYLSIFSNFKYIFEWCEPDMNNTSLIDMSILEAFEMVEEDPEFYGIIINPFTTHWIIEVEEITDYLKNNIR